MSSIDPTKEEKVFVEEMMDLPSEQQAEVIADRFAELSNLYEPLKYENIFIPNPEHSKPCPLFEPLQIYEKICKMKKKTATIYEDVHWRIIA